MIALRAAAQSQREASEDDSKLQHEVERTVAVCALQAFVASVEARSNQQRTMITDASTGHRRRLSQKPASVLHEPGFVATLTGLLSPGALRETWETEVCLAVQPDKFRTWGRHYLTTVRRKKIENGSLRPL